MIRLSTLGVVDLRTPDDRAMEGVLAQPKRLALLTYLAASDRVTFHRRDRLLATFWPALDESRARDALNQSLHFLRQTLGAETITVRGSDEVGIDRTRLWCDAREFREQLHAGDHETALGLYTGDFLDGFIIEAAPAFDEWVEAERLELRTLAARGARQLAEAHDARGGHTAALAWGKRAVHLAPDDERGFRRLLALFDRAGDRAGALQSYEEFAARLATEYGVEPAPETQAAVATIRRATEARPPDASPAGKAARSAPLQPGDRLSGDRYVIDGTLGAGATATVYRARDERYGRQVAVKVLRPELAAALGTQRFLAEIRMTATLQHPHILPLLDSGEADGLLFYVMPYAPGDTLRARLDRETQLPIADALRIGREVAGALAVAHASGIVHRDIKPENILLQDGHSLIADFGIALAVHQAGPRTTEIGVTLGTPEYMAPEQAVGAAHLDHRVDVYALGAVLYEMIGGQPPFTGPTPQAIIGHLLTDEPAPLVSLRPRVPTHIAEVIHRSLEKVPADRPSSVAELEAALTEEPPPGWIPVRRPDTRLRRSVRRPMLAVAGTIVLAAAAALVPGVMSDATRPPRVVRFTLDVPPELETVRSGSIANVAVSLAGDLVAFFADGGDHTSQLFVRSLDQPAPRMLPGTEGGTQPFFSPDGRWIGFWVAGRLKKVAVDGGVPQTIATMPAYYGASWTDAGDIVFSLNGRLMLISDAGGMPRALTAIDSLRGERLQQTPVAVPGGRHVLYSSWGDGGLEGVKIGVASLSSGRARRTDVAAAFPLGAVDGHVIAATASGGLVAVSMDLEQARATSAPTVVGAGIGFGAGGQAKAALSSSGTLIYVGGAPQSRIVLVDSTGVTVDTVVRDVRSYGFPRFSPDGRRIVTAIAAGRASDVWMYDLSSRTSTQLTSGGSINDRPEWSPDGSRVLYRTSRDSRSSIWWQPVDMREPAAPVLPGVQGHIFEAVMTPDGRGIVYQVDTSGADVEFRDLAGNARPRQIAAQRGAETMPRVSPDGRWVAFVTDETGARQVVAQSLLGSGARVQVSSEGGVEPVWARDGRALYYRAAGKVMAADVRATDVLDIVARRVLFTDRFVRAVGPHANFDVSPDGRRFLFLQAVDDARINVVLGWHTEVRQKLRAARGVGS